MKEEAIEEIAKKFNVNLKKLEEEQLKLSKTLKLKDSINFEEVEKICGVDTIFLNNNIIAAVIVINRDGEILDQKYFSEKARFPYIQGFRAYRELPAIISAFNLLEEKPELVFLKGPGILHPRKLDIASHFSISTGIPSIGVTDELVIGEIRGEDIFLNETITGKIVQSKKGSKPLFVSPGNLISIKTSKEITQSLIKDPHKFPEPLRLARKYVKEVMKEI